MCGVTKMNRIRNEIMDNERGGNFQESAGRTDIVMRKVKYKVGERVKRVGGCGDEANETTTEGGGGGADEQCSFRACRARRRNTMAWGGNLSETSKWENMLLKRKKKIGLYYRA